MVTTAGNVGAVFLPDHGFYPAERNHGGLRPYQSQAD